jgi:RHS repeat-associated protein
MYTRYDEYNDALIEKVAYRYDARGNPYSVTRMKPTATPGLWEQDRVNFGYGADGMVQSVVGEHFEDYEWFDNPFNDDFIEFALAPDPVTFGAAQMEAGSYASEVAQVFDEEEFDFLINQFGDQVDSNTGLWIWAEKSGSTWEYPDSLYLAGGYPFTLSALAWIGSGDTDRGWFDGQPDSDPSKDRIVFELDNTTEGRGGFRNVAGTSQHGAIFMRVSDVPEACYERTFAYEFRHDSLRARYMARELAPNDATNPQQLGGPFSPEQWHDYDGDMIYRDWTWDSDDVTLGTFHLPGIGRVTSPAAGEDPVYVHTDHLGTTRLITDNTETGGNPDPKIIYASIFTAFGEVISIDPDGEGTTYTPGTDQPDRYGYVGVHGYQSHVWHDDDTAWFPFHHVGARYYDPSTGRFLQRDPIGIFGGLNVYEYVESRATTLIDPSGLRGIGLSVPAALEAGFTAEETALMFTPFVNAGTDVAVVGAGAVGGAVCAKNVRVGRPSPNNPTPYPVPEHAAVSQRLSLVRRP